MANQGAKKRKEENTRHMANLRRLIIACNVFYYNKLKSSTQLSLLNFIFMSIYVDLFLWVYCYVSVGYLCVSEDGDLPFEFHLEALGWSSSHICGLCDTLQTTCQYGSTGLCR